MIGKMPKTKDTGKKLDVKVIALGAIVLLLAAFMIYSGMQPARQDTAKIAQFEQAAQAEADRIAAWINGATAVDQKTVLPIGEVSVSGKPVPYILTIAGNLVMVNVSGSERVATLILQKSTNLPSSDSITCEEGAKTLMLSSSAEFYLTGGQFLHASNIKLESPDCEGVMSLRFEEDAESMAQDPDLQEAKAALNESVRIAVQAAVDGGHVNRTELTAFIEETVTLQWDSFASSFAQRVKELKGFDECLITSNQRAMRIVRLLDESGNPTGLSQSLTSVRVWVLSQGYGITCSRAEGEYMFGISVPAFTLDISRVP